MEKPIMIEWKYYQCTWTVVDNVDVVAYKMDDGIQPLVAWFFLWFFITFIVGLTINCN